MKRVTQADGSWVEYSWATALTYTLDAAGNRTGEAIKDPGGVLQRSICLSFDVLGRL